MSSSTPQHLQTAHRQTAYALRTNAIEFVSHYGIDRCGFLNLTFQDRLYPIPARKKMSKALHVLADYCIDWIYTMGLGRNRRIHYHALVACADNLREGIDLSLYPRLLEVGDDTFPASYKLKA